ncbi:MAG: CoA transferase [Candidatus Lambdaproteobacteria bacterium]|nr:CoA transferase [Candidatus Lambdaproteobacteria bacterium]
MQGLNVVELGGWVSAPAAGKLLADLGATVVKVEPPAGDAARQRGPFPHGKPDPEASGLFLVLNANKRSVVLDLETAAGQRALDELAAQADILLHNFIPREMTRLRLDYERFAALNRRLVVLSITPYGLTGPYKDFAAVDLNLFHASGLSWVFADPIDIKGQPPVKFFGHQADIQGGVYGAVAALGAHYGAREHGQGEHIDLSVHSVNASFHGPNFVEFTYAGRVINRYKPRMFAPVQYYRCQDGYLFIVCPEEDQWQRLVGMMGDPEWAKAERFRTGWDRGAHVEEMNALLEAWTSTWRAEELFHALQQNHICATMLYRPADLFENAHLLARGFVHRQQHPVAGEIPMPGPPFVLQHRWWDVRLPAPRLDEARAELPRLLARNGTQAAGAGRGAKAGRQAAAAKTGQQAAATAKERPVAGNGAAGNGSARLPLQGVRVLDLTWYWAGPHCTEQMAHLGAEVIKIESPLRPDFTRRFAIYPEGMEGGLNRGGFFNEYAQSKKSVQIDIKHPEGLALIKRLAAVCDVAASNFSTGVMERFGLGAQELRRINPNMIVVTVSGFGQSGPLKDYIAYGPTVVPFAGLVAEPQGSEPPQYAATGYGDPNAGIYAAYGVLASLVARQRHGGGQIVDVSLWESMINNAFEGWINAALGHPPYPYLGNRDPLYAPHNCFRCVGDDAWVSIAVTDEAQWQGLCRALGRADLAGDARFATATARKANERALEEIVSTWTVTQDRWEATEVLQSHGVPSFPVIDTGELAENPHLHARGFFSRLPHPEVGVRTHTGIPWRLTRGPNGVRARAPLMGEHTDEVLREVLALDDAELARLRAAEAIW